MPRILILGGSREGSDLAAQLASRQDLTILSSLAGRVSQPKLPAGPVRIGGFGGPDALAAYLRDEKIDAVIDATHPYAAQIGRNAEAACLHAGIPLIALERPEWKITQGDRWLEFPDLPSAAAFLQNRQERVFLTIGRQGTGAFADCDKSWFLIRSIDPPEGPLPVRHQLLLARGPFVLEDELKLLREHSIDYLVSKNSGGAATYTKIEAARQSGIPIVMIQRPRKHTIPAVETVEEAICQLNRILKL